MVIPKASHLPATRNALADLSWAVHITYYAFVFSMPFLIFELGFSGSSIPKTLGYLFMMTTVLKPRICYNRLDKAIWFFAGFLVMYVFTVFWTIVTLPDPDNSNDVVIAFVGVFQTLVQM